MDRITILRDLRLGKYDCLIGINLLREGLDLPEVSLVAILDADKQGFLRSERSLVQTIGRAARNVNGRVIMYADSISPAMTYAINETNRRRELQLNFNERNDVVPVTVTKDIRDQISMKSEIIEEEQTYRKLNMNDKKKIIEDFEKEMGEAAKRLDFERAAELRDLIFELKADLK